MLISPYPNLLPGKSYAGMIVYNEKNFCDIMKNKFNKRKPRVKFGSRYNAIYVLPLAELGGILLKNWLLAYSPSDRNTISQDIATKGYGMKYSRDANLRKSFLFLDKYGPVFIGVDMDLVSIMRANQTIQANDIREFSILCFPAQVDYYRKLWNMGRTLRFYSMNPWQEEI